MTPDPKINDALRALLDYDEEYAEASCECVRCGTPICVRDGCEPTPECDSCAQELLHQVRAQLAARNELCASPKNDSRSLAAEGSSAQWAMEAAKEILAASLPTMSFYLRTEDCERDRQQIVAAIIQKHAPIGSSPSAQGEDSALSSAIWHHLKQQCCATKERAKCVVLVHEEDIQSAVRAARKETAMATKEAK
jgi:hypothetical protein